jgi:leucyl/phenylalanyl-tRNA--protein transferase
MQGIFPMSPHKDSIDPEETEWYLPKVRGIIPMDGFRLSKNSDRLRRNKIPHSIRYNSDFRGVIEGCAARPETWISPLIIESYVNLHHLGYAHSVEIYNESDELIGGLYGVALGTAFFGESMFHFQPEADKFALFYCHQRLKERGFTLWDTQFYTDHLGTLGGIAISNADYQHLLKQALAGQARFG